MTRVKSQLQRLFCCGQNFGVTGLDVVIEHSKPKDAAAVEELISFSRPAPFESRWLRWGRLLLYLGVGVALVLTGWFGETTRTQYDGFLLAVGWLLLGMCVFWHQKQRERKWLRRLMHQKPEMN